MGGWTPEWLAEYEAKRKQPRPAGEPSSVQEAPLPPSRPTPAKGVLPEPPEDDLQISVATFLDLALPPPLRWLHIPNGGSRNAAEAGKLKAMGVKPGAADVLILGFHPFVWIELKTSKGRLRPAQAEWRDWCRSIGAPWFLCRSLEDVIRALESLQIRLIGRLT